MVESTIDEFEFPSGIYWSSEKGKAHALSSNTAHSSSDILINEKIGAR